MRVGVFRNGAAVAVCLLFSLLLHLALALILLTFASQEPQRPTPPQTARSIRLHKLAAQQEEKPACAPQKEKPLPFAKTNPDLPEKRPERRDFVGKRNARAASDEDARHLVGESPLPSMTGEKKEEAVSFDQEAQPGDLEHDGRRQSQPRQATAPPPAPALAPPPGGRAHAVAPPTATPLGELNIAPPDTPENDTPHRPKQEQDKQADMSPAPMARPLSPTPPTPVPPAHPAKTARAYPDPSLADPSPPGFRTKERRSRQAGHFVLGHGASLNVSATPKGHYEEEIYRRIAYWWYRACDEHRGDIIPGKIVISLRLNNRGRLVNMDLVQRSGAGVIQQSFTFGAIRQASLPPMPPAVREEIVGDLLELIFEFVFN